MDIDCQYKCLVDMVANARVLAANSNDDTVVKYADKIKGAGVKMAKRLGITEEYFAKDTINVYKRISSNLK